MADDPRSAWLHATELSPDAAARVRARLRAPAPPERRSIPLWPVGLGLAAAAAGLAVAVRWDPAAELPLPHVAVEMAGDGEVRGTRSRPEIVWSQGRLTVEVEPDQGVHLSVTTAEAEVEVVGTAFAVDRANYATTVSVSHGTVRVACAGEPAVALSSGSVTCLPDDAPTLLLRLVGLGTSSASERLDAADRALALGDAALRPELLAHRVQALIDLGRAAEAVDAAEAYLATGEQPRRAALISYVARARYAAERCGARDALERAVAELPPGQERVILASCVLDQDPARAKALAEGAEAWATGPWLELARRIRER